MDLEILHEIVERFRKATIGTPKLDGPRHVYEYPEQTPRLVAVLKLVRATHGVTAMYSLCRAGLLIDFGVAARCFYDSLQELYFLIEEYPKSSPNVDQFVKQFFEGTIDGHLNRETHAVPTKKVRAAWVRVLSEGQQNEEARKVLERIYETFSGYVHGSYAHTMEVYNGWTDDFNLAGVPEEAPRADRMQHVVLGVEAVMLALAVMARRFGMDEFDQEASRLLNAMDET